MANSIQGDLYVSGTMYASGLTIPANSVVDSNVSPAAAILANKVQHAFRATYQTAQTDAAASLTRTLHVANGAGTIKSAKFGAITPAVGAATVTFNIRKNGVNVLTGVGTLSSSQASRVLVVGSIDPAQATVATGDVIDVVFVATVSTGTLPNGVFGFVDLYEAVAA